MSELIDEILNINKIAEKKVLDAKKEEEILKQNIAKKKQELMELIKKKADVDLLNFENSELKIFEEKIKILKQEKTQKIESLNKMFSKNCDSFVNMIVLNTLQ